MGRLLSLAGNRMPSGLGRVRLVGWGFDCGHGWVHWRDFTSADNPGAVGRGCGEPGDLSPVSVPGTTDRRA